MVITAKKYKKLINNYALSKKGNEYIHTYSRGVYDSRFFGFCIIRNKKLFKELAE